MVFAVGLAEALPLIDSTADCEHCGGTIAWYEGFGWLHVTGWYACRWPQTGVPRELMAAPAEGRP